MDILRRIVHAVVEHVWLDASVLWTQSKWLEQVLELGAQIIRPVSKYRVVLPSRSCLLCVLNGGLAIR